MVACMCHCVCVTCCKILYLFLYMKHMDSKTSSRSSPSAMKISAKVNSRSPGTSTASLFSYNFLVSFTKLYALPVRRSLQANAGVCYLEIEALTVLQKTKLYCDINLLGEKLARQQEQKKHWNSSVVWLH